MSNISVKTSAVSSVNEPKKRETTIQTILPYLLLAASVIGLIASFALTYDKIHLLENPHFKLGCNINPIISCGDVMKTEQSNLLGVPNPVYGLMAFSLLAMFGLMLLAGARFKRWMWWTTQGAATVGVIFMHYLFFQGVYRINAICPWCFVVWMITIPVFWAITVYNYRSGLFGEIHHKRIKRFFDFFSRHAGDVLLVWYLIIFAILLTHFWYYWKTVI